MIILCVGSAYVIKLINEYQLNYREIIHSLKVSREVVDRQQIVNRTVETVAVPVSVTALTTVTGFAALMINPIPAIKELGLYSSIGIIFITLFALTLAPAILRYLQIPVTKVFSIQADSMNFLLDGLKQWIRRHSRRLILFRVLRSAFAAVGMIWIKIDSSSKSFPDDSPVIRDLKLVEDNLAGTDTLRLVFHAPAKSSEAKNPAENPLKTAKSMLGLQKLQEWMEQRHGSNELSEIKGLVIDKVYSPVTYLNYFRAGLDSLTDDEVSRFYADLKHEKGPKFLD